MEEIKKAHAKHGLIVAAKNRELFSEYSKYRDANNHDSIVELVEDGYIKFLNDYDKIFLLNRKNGYAYVMITRNNKKPFYGWVSNNDIVLN